MTDRDTMGVLLMAYGTPDKPEEIEPYYTHIRHGHPPPPDLLKELQDRYALVGGRTPLTDISRATRTGLEERLNAAGEGHYRVALGMKHWHPYIEQAVGEMATAGIGRAVGLVLAPHYSSYSVKQYYEYVARAQEKWGTSIEIDRIDQWHLWPPYLRAVAHRIQGRLAEFLCGSEVMVVFTAHSVPEKIVQWGDPYPDQLAETARTLAEMLHLEHWTFSYQSAGRTADPWLGPDLLQTINRLADDGVKHVLVASIGFVSDHLEILYDIDFEARGLAEERGMSFKRTAMLNASPDFLDGLAELVLERVADPGAGEPS